MAKIDPLFDQLIQDNGSDLHLHEGRQPRYRINGSLIPMPNQAAVPEMQMVALLHEICPKEKWSIFEATGDVDFAYAHRNKARFRVNYNMNNHGNSAVFRLIPPIISNLHEIGAPDALRQFAVYPSGLCLVTGPTGSGKSTTLAALIDDINTSQSRLILTVEDPIEFVHTNKKCTVIQREVGDDVDSFGLALRNGVRQDVQVILVGEMRDLETVELAMTAAEMGMLVFATLHTNSAVRTVDRIIDVFPADQQSNVRESLANSLRAICSQRLLKRADGRGRIAAHEIMFQTPAVANLIRENKTNQLPQVIMSNRAMGMQLLDDVLQNYVKQGLVTGQEAYRKANEKEGFRQFVPGA
ncbi:MAG: PilT/PilU family type 4a pilus ATPase [Candidatus Sumerlaeaceae bacterium]|nr:PilT/PilU family type 4a pilus ATPase [Candidatus Sumerlaeaceae bacterium]